MSGQSDLTINLEEETQALLKCLKAGDPNASHHLARLIEADTRGVFLPFADALSARLRDHLQRFAEINITDPDETLDEEVYQLLKGAAVDWSNMPTQGRMGEGQTDVSFV